MAWQKATAQTVMVTFYAAGEPIAPTGALAATISKDGTGFGAVGGSVALVAGTPCALLTLNTADTNCDAGCVKIVDAGGAADDRYVEFTTEAAYTAARATLLDSITTLVNRLGAFTGTGINTVLGFLRALAAKATSLTPTDLSTGTTYDNTAHSQEANRDRGDAAWTTATGFAVPGSAMALTSGERTTLSAVIWNALTSGMTTAGSIGKKLADWVVLTSQAIRDAMKLAPGAGDPIAGSVDKHLDDILEDTSTTLPALINALGPGTGTHITNVTLRDSVTEVGLPDASILVYADEARTTIAGQDHANVSGIAQVRLDAETTYYYNAKCALYADASGDFTTGDESPESVIVELTALVAPDAPADPDTLTIYADFYQLTGLNVGMAGTMTAVSASPSTDGGLSFVPTAWPSDATDANGRAQLTLVRGLEVVVRLSAAEREWYYRGTVPADDPENPDGGTMTLQMLLNDHEWEQIPAAVYTSAERKQQ